MLNLDENELAGPEEGDTSFPYGYGLATGGPVRESGGVFGALVPLNIEPLPSAPPGLMEADRICKREIDFANKVDYTPASSTAEEMRRRIFNVLENTTAQVFTLEQSWIRLGVLLSSFKEKEYWREFKEYPTFDDFISELKHRFNRGRTQLYSYLGVAEALLPTIGAEKLEQMGISKALELKRAMKKLEGKPLPAGLLEAALDPSKTTSELRGAVGAALHITEDPKGTWMDLQGFFMLPDERKEFKEAFLATEALLALSNTLPDHIRRKEVILAWMREFYGTHAAEYNGVQQPDNTEPQLIAGSAGWEHPRVVEEDGSF